MNRQGLHAYRRTDVLTADPKRLVIMCYEEAIRNLKLAKQSSQERNYERASRAVQKSQDILAELLGALDFKKGGEIAKNLQAIYTYMARRILQGHVQNELETAADEVVGMLDELKEAWEQIFYGGGKAAKDIQGPDVHLPRDGFPGQSTLPATYGRPSARL
ncbi:MAG: flagellar export chaperone FliS [Deltaproteobacteria bacterium]|nr:flagellar export chaperone FliS [Deltaproteobacteria bacterium]